MHQAYHKIVWGILLLSMNFTFLYAPSAFWGGLLILAGIKQLKQTSPDGHWVRVLIPLFVVMAFRFSYVGELHSPWSVAAYYGIYRCSEIFFFYGLLTGLEKMLAGTGRIGAAGRCGRSKMYSMAALGAASVIWLAAVFFPAHWLGVASSVVFLLAHLTVAAAVFSLRNTASEPKAA